VDLQSESNHEAIGQGEGGRGPAFGGS